MIEIETKSTLRYRNNETRLIWIFTPKILPWFRANTATMAYSENYCHLIFSAFPYIQFVLISVAFVLQFLLFFSKDSFPRHKRLQSRAASINWKEFWLALQRSVPMVHPPSLATWTLKLLNAKSSRASSLKHWQLKWFKEEWLTWPNMNCINWFMLLQRKRLWTMVLWLSRQSIHPHPHLLLRNRITVTTDKVMPQVLQTRRCKFLCARLLFSI